MYLSRLELHGFKSFADKTVLDFAPGITAIVGPNGCGKSNIVDAVRWVIGEQRARVLRSEKMNDVIFNGTANRRPLGMAEVQLTIENTRSVLPTEYAEVMIGRRLYRSGDSEYLMNDVQSRLKDIQDLFMDTGMGAGAYSVIELKMIDEILSESAEDRRHLFEEAAGITKYKQRRTQALRKLDSTQADLTRVRDLTDEIEKTVRRLKRQAEKAVRFKELDAALRTLELQLAQAEYDRLRERQRRLQAARQELQDQLETHTTQITVAESNLEALRKKQVDQEQALAARQQTLNKHLEQVRSLETERRLAQERLEAAQRDQERTQREQEAAEERRRALNAAAKRLAGDLSAAEPTLEQAEAALRETQAARDAARAAAEEQQEHLRTLRRQEKQAEDQLAERRRTLDRLSNRIELMEREQMHLYGQRETLDKSKETLEARAWNARQRLEETKAAVEAKRVALANATIERETHLQALDEATEALRALERRRDAVDAEVQLLESLVSSYEEFSDTIQFLAVDPSWRNGETLHTVADVLGCADNHRRALDAALGDLASCIVVETEAEVEQALARLRAEEKGRATFLVLNRLHAPAPPDAAPGDEAVPLRALVQLADSVYQPLADLLLQRCYFAETLERARTLAATRKGPGRFFTAAGEWVDADGLEHGGSIQASGSPVASRFGRREQLEQARNERAHLDEALATQTAEVETVREALEAVSFEATRQALERAERTFREDEQIHERTTYEQQQVTERHTDLGERLAGLKASLKEDRTAFKETERAVAETQKALTTHRSAREEAEAAFEEAEAASRTATSRHNDANLKVIQTSNQRDNLRRELERTRQALDDLQTRAAAREEHLDDLRTRIATSEETLVDVDKRLRTIHQDRSGLEEAVHAAQNLLTETKAAISDIEHRLRALRRDREDVMRAENEHNVRLAQVQTRTEDLLASIAEDYERDLTQTPVALDDTFDEDPARTEVRDLRSKIKKLGSVNPLALEEYEEEKERLDFLLAQREDLEAAEETLLETISEINTTASERFEETFTAIRNNFQRIFARLFESDATADLVLEDASDPLDSPIEIMAKPRGKRPSVLTQLSSGEKTLTAIALLFAIYLVKPSPFCILDEVDAPLDDMNVERFMKLIKEFSSDTQFIIVTHNKLTMEAADRLYGITMQEQGVSRLVGVHFDEAVEMVG